MTVLFYFLEVQVTHWLYQLAGLSDLFWIGMAVAVLVIVFGTGGKR